MKAIAVIKKEIYDNVRQRRPYVFNEWKWYSYRKFKARLYINGASLFTYFFLKIPISANVVTLIYVLMGIFGGILLALPSKFSVIVAITFFYFRGIFDWTDGVIARFKKQTSISGCIFDSYGALAGWVSLWTGMGFYLSNNTSYLFYYMIPILPAIFAADLHLNARETFIYHYLIKKEYRNTKNNFKDILAKNNISSNKGHSKIEKIKYYINKIFEHNARTVDIICLMILIETFSTLRILWVFYLTFLIWRATVFIARFFLIMHGGWAETELRRLKDTIYK